MKFVPIYTLIVFFLISILINPLRASADSLPFDIEKKDHSKIESIETESTFTSIIDNFNTIFAPMYGWGIKIVTILFLVGSLVMILSALFKHGQWQKYGQMTMLFSFLTMILLRGMPIIVLSINNYSDFDNLLQITLKVLSDGAVYLAAICITVSYLFSFGYQLIKHPEYHRRTKNLRSIAILMLIFSFGFPAIYALI